MGGMGFGIQIAGNAMKVLAKAAKDANKRVMATVKKAALRVQRGAKENVKTKLNTTGLSTGTLGRSIGIVARPAQLEADIGPSVIYGRIHEFGGVIKPVKAQALAFEIKGQLILAQSVTIPKRPYLQPALDDAQPAIRRDFEGMVGVLLEE